MLPALGIVPPTGSKLKGGTLSLEIDSAGPLNKVVSTGWVKMSNTGLEGFSLVSKLSAIPGLAGKQSGNDTAIENLSCDVRNAPDGTRLDKINAVIPSLGTVTGAGTISPNKELNFKMLANLAGAGAAVTNVAGLGAGGIPVAVGGTASNPTFAPDMKAVAGGVLKSVIPGEKGNPLSGVFGKKKPK
jgi:AsmA protein